MCDYVTMSKRSEIARMILKGKTDDQINAPLGLIKSVRDELRRPLNKHYRKRLNTILLRSFIDGSNVVSITPTLLTHHGSILLQIDKDLKITAIIDEYGIYKKVKIDERKYKFFMMVIEKEMMSMNK